MTKLWQRLLMQQSAPVVSGYRYYQIKLRETHGDPYYWITELALKSSPGGLNILTPSMPITASTTYHPDYAAAKCIDGITTSSFISGFISASKLTDTLTIDLGYQAAAAELGIHKSPGAASRNIKKFEVYGSNISNSGPWQLIKGFDGAFTGAPWQTYSLT